MNDIVLYKTDLTAADTCRCTVIHGTSQTDTQEICSPHASTTTHRLGTRACGREWSSPFSGTTLSPVSDRRHRVRRLTRPRSRLVAEASLSRPTIADPFAFKFKLDCAAPDTTAWITRIGTSPIFRGARRPVSPCVRPSCHAHVGIRDRTAPDRRARKGHTNPRNNIGMQSLLHI